MTDMSGRPYLQERKLSYWSSKPYERRLSFFSSRPAEMGVPKRLLHVGVLIIICAYLYTLYSRSRSRDTLTNEQIVFDSWSKIVETPSFPFKKIVVGINSNVDLIVPGTHLLTTLNSSPGPAKDHELVNTLAEMQEVFAMFFTRGAPVERYITSAELFQKAVEAAELMKGVEWSVGGNAAIMAERIASRHSKTKVVLVGPIGPKLKSLLHTGVSTHNSTKIARDEIHVILEYKQGEIWGEFVSPASGRFIASHDSLSSSAIVMDMFFNTVHNLKPDLVIFSGLHLLDAQPAELWQEKLKTVKRNLNQVNRLVPIHLELGSVADREYAKNLLFRIIPYVDSVALNEQELTFLSTAGEGPHADLFPPTAGSLHVHKVIDMLHWLLDTFGHDKEHAESRQFNYRLQRLHFQCLTYHVIALRGGDWSNSASALAVGAQTAALQACGLKQGNQIVSNLVELRVGNQFIVDKIEEKTYHFTPHSPLMSWTRGNVLFIFTPVLVCKYPTRTVGLEDIISAAGLMHSQFRRSDKLNA